MSGFRGLSVLVRLAVVVVLVPFAIWESIQRNAHDDANRIPTQKMTRAQDILRMWATGVSPKHVPIMRPEEAGECLRYVVASQADAELKNQAKELLNAMEAHKNYFAFANSFREFEPEIENFLSLYRKRGEVEKNGIAPQPAENLRPKFLVISMGHRDTSGPMILGEPEPHDQTVASTEPFFDAEMIDACGDRCAKTSAEVRTVIVLEWNRTRIGDYKLDRLGLNGVTNKLSDDVRSKSGIPAVVRGRYNEECTLEIFDFPTRRYITHMKIECTDPEILTFGSGSASDSATGFDTLRRQVKQCLSKLGRLPEREG